MESIERNRLRFSDLCGWEEADESIGGLSRSTSSDGTSVVGRTAYELVGRLSASLTSVSTQSLPSLPNGEDFLFLPPAARPTTAASCSSSPSSMRRQSCVTTSSGTTVWTVQGGSTTRSVTSAASSSNRDQVAPAEVARGCDDSFGRAHDHHDIQQLGMEPEPAGQQRQQTTSTTTTPTPAAAVVTTPQNGQNSPSTVPAAIADDTDELPPTQPTGPLKGVVAYVEVHSGAENRSSMVGNVMRDMGAVVSQRFTNKVSHVVFSEGRRSTLDRARLRNVHLVSVLWVDKCRRENGQVPEAEFTISAQDCGIPATLGRTRRIRSMEPKPSDTQLSLTDDYLRKRRQRLEAARWNRQAARDIREGRFVCSVIRDPIMVPASRALSPPSPLRTAGSFTNLGNTPVSLRKQVAHVRKKILHTGDDDGPEEEDEVEEEEDTLRDSLRRKLFGVGGRLHGSPVPDFLRRSKRAAADRQPARAGESSSGLADHQSTSTSTTTKTKTTIEQIISQVVCEDAGGPDVAADRNNKKEADLPKKKNRRIFDSGRDRLSSRMRAVSDEGAGSPAKKRATDESLVRLPSSVFRADASDSFLRDLQTTRRSSHDFVVQPGDQKKKKRTKKNNTDKKAPRSTKTGVRKGKKRLIGTLVMTNLKQDDRETVRAISKRLKGFRVGSRVTETTSHVVCGGDGRTATVLMGVARGCWMMPLDWVYQSLAGGHWLKEDEFELADRFPGAQAVRNQKGGSAEVTCGLFRTLGPIYVGPDAQPPVDDVCSLIRWCGGKLVPTRRRAQYCFGCKQTADGGDGAVVVKETWILDSIMDQRVHPVDQYTVQDQ